MVRYVLNMGPSGTHATHECITDRLINSHGKRHGIVIGVQSPHCQLLPSEDSTGWPIVQFLAPAGIDGIIFRYSRTAGIDGFLQYDRRRVNSRSGRPIDRESSGAGWQRAHSSSVLELAGATLMIAAFDRWHGGILVSRRLLRSRLSAKSASRARFTSKTRFYQ